MLLRTPDPLFLARAGGSGNDTNMEVANTLIIARLCNFKCGWSNLILGISILLDKAGVQTNSIIQTISYRYSLHENHILCSYSEQSRSNSAKGICVEVHVVITLIPSNQPPKASLVSCTYMIELLHSTKHVALAIIFICLVVCAVIFLFLVLACLQSLLTLLLLQHCM